CGTLLRTAQVVLPDSALARRRAGEDGTKCRGREGVSRRPPALPREWLVPVRARAGAPGAGEEHRGGRSGSALPPSVGEHGRDTDGIEVLANELPSDSFKGTLQPRVRLWLLALLTESCLRSLGHELNRYRGLRGRSASWIRQDASRMDTSIL